MNDIDHDSNYETSINPIIGSDDERHLPGRPVVLVTNDDGIDSPGIVALAAALEARGLEVVVAAPATNMSGASAAIGPIDPQVPARRVVLDGITGSAFAVQAPPAMIVIAALSGAFGPVPTAVASGVNDGVNLGRAILHSGTVGAALTGHNLGLQAIAVSLQPGGDWTAAAAIGADIFTAMSAADTDGTEVGPLANVNVPAGADVATERVSTELARFGAATAAIVGDALDFQLTIDADALADPGSDGAAVAAGKVSVSWLGGFSAVRSDATFSLRPVDPTLS